MSKRKPELKLVEDTGSQLESEELIPELPPQQSEMPFAMVEGEPYTELPRDLYIPPDALQVFLEAFEGPLDLLLYLIRKQNLDILDIPIAEITRQYMKYIEVMAELQLELAGEYLLMAAMLAEIKSRMLLPRPPAADGQDEDDPRAELVRRLQEYERFKKAAEDIDALSRQERDTLPASVELEERKVVRMLPDVTLQEMLMAFRDVLTRAEKFAHHHISRERLSVRQRMSDILSNLQNVAFFDFSQLFNAQEGRMGVTVTFIAILELMKEGLIEIVQAEAYAPIHVRSAQGARHLKVVPSGAAAEADAENAAALAQPTLPDENELPEEEDEPAAEEILAEDGSAAPLASEIEEIVAAQEIVSEEAAVELPVTEETAAEHTVPEETVVTETEVPEHVVEEHVVPDHTVEEHVVEEHVVTQNMAEDTVTDAAAEDAPADTAIADTALPGATESTQLSPGDDSVTESSSEADNSDAEPSR